jgi:ABC-2 type transport system ATP-binding protein
MADHRQSSVDGTDVEMDRRTLLKASGVAAAGAAVGPQVASAERSSSSVSTEYHTIESWDGTELETTLYLPEGSGPHPAVLMTHGWGAFRQSPITVPKALNYAKNGYVVLTYDSRGFAGSSGTVTLNGEPEVKDAQHLITWLANRSDVATEGADNPWIGMDGISYAGGIQFLVSAADDRLDAMVPRITWRDLEYSLAPNGVIKIGWLSALLGIGEFNTLLDGDADMTDDLADWYWHAVENNEVPDDALKAFEERSAAHFGGIDTPALLMQGWNDSLFNPTEALRTYEELQNNGVESRLLFYKGGHDLTEVVVDFDDRGHMNNHSVAWMDRHLRGKDTDVPQVQNYLSQRDEWRSDEEWPPADTTYNRLELGNATINGKNELGKENLWFGDTEVTYEWTMGNDIEVIGEPEIELALDVHGPEARVFFELFHNGSNINGMDEAYLVGSGSQTISTKFPGVQQFLGSGDTIGLNVSVTNLWYIDSRDSDGLTIDPGASSMRLPTRGDPDPQKGSDPGGGGGPGFTMPAVGAALGGTALYKRYRGD